MKSLLSVLVAFMTIGLVAEDAEARRLGGGRNLGIQRSAPPPQKTAPAQQQQQPSQQSAPTTPASQPAGASKWLGPLAGLGLGAGLAALFLHNGWAGALAGLLAFGLLAAVLLLVARALRGQLVTGPLRYESAGAPGTPRAAPAAGAGAFSVSAATGRWPAGFDAADFVRHARLNFVRLQAAHDRGDLSTIRDFLTPEVYREIEADSRAAAGTPQHTEVLTLEAEVLDVVAEQDTYEVSVRFTGMIREAEGADAAPFSETWHLQKPVGGNSGWLVAGIQQAGS